MLASVDNTETEVCSKFKLRLTLFHTQTGLEIPIVSGTIPTLKSKLSMCSPKASVYTGKTDKNLTILLFTYFQVQARGHGFQVGMKLEAVDRKNPDLICVATVTNVIGNHFLVHFDEWDDSYDYWCQDDCPYIHPVGWCAENGKKLNPPNGE